MNERKTAKKHFHQSVITILLALGVLAVNPTDALVIRAVENQADSGIEIPETVNVLPGSLSVVSTPEEDRIRNLRRQSLTQQIEVYGIMKDQIQDEIAQLDRKNEKLADKQKRLERGKGKKKEAARKRNLEHMVETGKKREELINQYTGIQMRADFCGEKLLKLLTFF